MEHFIANSVQLARHKAWVVGTTVKETRVVTLPSRTRGGQRKLSVERAR